MYKRNIRLTGFKIKRKLLISFLTLFIIFISKGNNVYGQNTMDLTLGIGFPTLINAGVRAQLEQYQIGVSIGSFPFSDKTFLTLSGAVYYHFGDHSKYSKRDVTYVKASLNYYEDENESARNYTALFGISAGRDIYYSRRVGINLDGGLFFRIKNFEQVKDPSGAGNMIIPAIMPYVSINLFYRL
jgi:hypothetical protein